jgi:hypothetical protein
MRPLFVSFGLAVALVASAAQANAAPITYEFSGTASGAIGGTSFTDALVVFTGVADTDDVTSLLVSGFTFYAVPLDHLTVDIAGIGTATITVATEIFDIPLGIDDPSGQIPALPGLILGRVDNPPDLDSFTGMAGVFSDSLSGYDLTTSTGPVGGFGGVGFIEDCGTSGIDPCIQTSLGALSLTTNIFTEGGGTFEATVQAVPEPSTLLLMGAGLLATRLRRRKA